MVVGASGEVWVRWATEREGLARCARGCAPLPPRGNAPHGALRRSVERRVLIKSSLSAIHKKARPVPGFFVYGGEGGIRTLRSTERRKAP